MTVQLATRLFRVHGPPGCGKTTWLSRQALIASAKYGGDRLIVASLTRAAAAEVAGRDTGIPRQNVGTLHAHAHRALGRPELADTLDGLKVWNEQAPANLRILTAARDPEHANPEDGPTAGGGRTDGEKYLAQVGVLRAQLRPATTWPPLLQRFHAQWSDWKRQTNRLDFTDLIERACLIPHPLNPRIVFLDEAQDMSALEMQLALHWATEAEQTIIVGDADQCLFEWRGSSQQAFLGPVAVEERTLSQSYRVPRAVHAYAVQWISQVRDRPRIEYEPRDAPGSVQTFHATYTVPHPVVAAVARQPGTSMILATCAYMLEPVLRELRAQGVPFHNPYRRTNGRWNPLAAAGRPLAFLRPHATVWGADHRLWTFNELRQWLEPLAGQGWLVRGSKEDVKGVCASGQEQRDEVVPMDYFASLLGGPDAAAASAAITSRDPMVALAWWASKLRAKEATRYAYPLQIAERYGVAHLREEPRVVVGTIHSVKGGEADAVYVFPDLSLAAHSDPDGHAGWAHGGVNRHPILRLFYVAFTRARSDLYLCMAASNLAVELPAPNPPNGGVQNAVPRG